MNYIVANTSSNSFSFKISNLSLKNLYVENNNIEIIYIGNTGARFREMAYVNLEPIKLNILGSQWTDIDQYYSYLDVNFSSNMAINFNNFLRMRVLDG